MQTISIYTVIQQWYDFDTHDPSDALVWNRLYAFDNELEAERYASIRNAEYMYNEYGDEGATKERHRQDDYYFVETAPEYPIYSNIGELPERK